MQEADAKTDYPKTDWLICVPPLADVDHRPDDLLIRYDEARKVFRDKLGNGLYVKNYPSPSWDQKYGSLGHLYRVDVQMVAVGIRLYLDLCKNYPRIQQVHFVATESGAYLVMKTIEFIKRNGCSLRSKPAKLDVAWKSFLVDPLRNLETSGPSTRNDGLYSRIKTVEIIEPSLPPPSGFAWLVWSLARPDIYYHMVCPFDHDGSGESPQIRVIWVNRRGDVNSMNFTGSNSQYLEQIDYDPRKPNLFRDLINDLFGNSEQDLSHSENGANITPPQTVDRPHKDLTGQVKRSSNNHIDHSTHHFIYRGEWNDPTKDHSTIVAIKVPIKAPREDMETISKCIYHDSWAWDRLRNRNVLPFFGVSDDAGLEGHAPALISQFCANGNVLNYLKRNLQADRLRLVVGAARGLQYLHSKDIIHGDMKPQNVLVSDDGDALLGDYGRCGISGPGDGTALILEMVEYQAPELAVLPLTQKGDDFNQSYVDQEILQQRVSTKTDIYAYAMVALQVCW